MTREQFEEHLDAHAKAYCDWMTATDNKWASAQADKEIREHRAALLAEFDRLTALVGERRRLLVLLDEMTDYAVEWVEYYEATHETAHGMGFKRQAERITQAKAAIEAAKTLQSQEAQP